MASPEFGFTLHEGVELETLAQAIEAEESLCCYEMDTANAPRFIEFELEGGERFSIYRLDDESREVTFYGFDDDEDCTYNEEEYDAEEEPFDEDDCPACCGAHRYGDTTGSVGFAVRKLLTRYAD